MFSIGLMNHLQGQGCKNPENQAALEKISLVAPNICGSKGGNLIHVTSMVRGIFMWLLDFWKTCTTLYRVHLSHKNGYLLFTVCSVTAGNQLCDER
jgi:hypothetical protein